MFRSKSIRLLFLLLSLAATAAPASGIYRSVDAQGRVTYSDTPSANAQPVKITGQPSRQLYQVTRVYDGDTIILEGRKQVRLLGVNTPEIESRHRNEEPGGVAAKKWLQNQLRDNQVYLEFDQVKRDKYKRLLAHVFLPNGKHVNLALLESGLAAISIIPPNGRYSDKLIQAQQFAEKQKLGIWSMPEYQSRPITEIANHTKGWQRFTGTPVAIRKSRKFTRLLFNDKVDIRVANSNLKLFPELATYVGKPLEVRGWVTRNKDHYTMLIQHPSALIAR
ncbi:thermonuclease family protein [Nitrosomonas sp. Is24]|uniref:thermonuclease family protein n=1 Tax=Nitrosomonas sp. Is24 TaxID=3080533 RepID=UPI00294B73F3|nr:thermonuclease family protein [Nitrosomonas sp. Is24]MDV6341607.1 thermonuclease family protein [Nitrosomonas sp. Is24]